MSRIQIISDLHLEAPKSYDAFNITPNAPHLALIGDIGCTKDAGYTTFLEKQLSNFEIVFVVLGNHEPYHSSWKSARDVLKGFESEITARETETTTGKKIGKFVLLNQTRYDLSPNVTVLGCTLFSNIVSSQFDHVSFGLNDFYHIKDWTAEEHNKAHIEDLKWLNEQVTNIASAEPERKIIILTHYSPTTSPRASDPVHASSKISSGFSSDLAGEGCWRSQNVKIWVFGHTHFNCDFVVEESGLRVVTNQRGYYFNQTEGFDGQKCVEI
jgi:predicted phosphodiesterase